MRDRHHAPREVWDAGGVGEGGGPADHDGLPAAYWDLPQIPCVSKWHHQNHQKGAAHSSLTSVSAETPSLNLVWHCYILKFCSIHKILLFLGKIMKSVTTSVVIKSTLLSKLIDLHSHADARLIKSSPNPDTASNLLLSLVWVGGSCSIPRQSRSAAKCERVRFYANSAATSGRLLWLR